MTRVVVKKKTKRKPGKKFKSKVAQRQKDFTRLLDEMEEAAQAEIEDWKKYAEIRGKMADEAIGYQDASTRVAINTIVRRLTLGANGVIRIIPKGYTEAVPVQVPVEYLMMHAKYVATEIIKDFALFDIRIANYQFPPMRCADCGKKLKPRKKKKQ